MRRLVPILAALLFYPLAAFGQMVSPGGGNYTGAIVGGACTNPEFVQAINMNGAVTCATPVGGGGGGGNIAGDVPQLVGFSATNVPAGMNITGDVTFAAGAAGTYVATVTDINGTPPGPLATLGIGNGLSSDGTNLNIAAPVSVANGGTGYTGTATSPQILIAQTSGAFAPHALSGDVTITAAGVATVHSIGGAAGPFMGQSSPTFTGTMTGPNINLTGSLTFNGNPVGGTCTTGQLMNGLSASLIPACVPISSGTGIIINNGVISLSTPITVGWGGLGQGSFPPTAGQVLIALNPTNYIPRTISGDLTIGATGTAVVTQVNGVVPGGACTAGSYVVSLNSSAVPTCSANLGTVYAPLVNPASGQNNYAPLANPTFSGTTTVANLTAPSTATWTFPDGSTYTTNGHNNMKALGIGAPAPTAAGTLEQVTATGNYQSAISVTSTSNGGSAGAVIRLNNDVSGAWLAMNSSGYNTQGPNVLADSLQIGSNGHNGMYFYTNANDNPGPPIVFWSGPYISASMFGGQPGGNAGIMIGSTGSLVWQSYITPNAYIASGGVGNFNIGVGGHVNNAGSAWVADATTASIISVGQNVLSFFNNTGLTVGSTFGPAPTAQFVNTGTTPTSAALVFPQVNYSQIQFGTYQNPTASILGYSTGGGLHLNAGAYWNGSGWYMGGNNAEDISLQASAPIGQIAFNIAAYGSPGGIGWSTVGQFEFSSLTAGPVQGLDLSGFANRVGTGEAVASLTIGNSYLSGTNWANLNLSGASYPINNGSGWQADCGAGSGMALITIGPGPNIGFWNHGALGCNAGFTWNNIGSWAVTGMTVTHIQNNETGDPPTVSSGALVKGSRDMFGWIVGVKGGETTLTFRDGFDGESNCTLTAAGQPNLWFDAGQAPGQVTFACVVPWTGDPCPDDSWVEYHCFGHGDQAAQTKMVHEVNRPHLSR